MKLLFVCTGNTCRSPMAQALGNAQFPSHSCSSAGLFAYPGQSLSPMAKKVLDEVYGLSDFVHSAKLLTQKEIDEADLVIAMTAGHKARMEAFFGLHPKFVSMPKDIPDPYGENEETYRQCAEEILKGIETLIREGVICD